jgi:transposase-like protein
MALEPRRTAMPRKRHKPEEIVAKLRQIDVLVTQGQSVADAIRSIGVTEVTYYRWRQEFGGLKSDQVKRLKDLETENTRLEPRGKGLMGTLLRYPYEVRNEEEYFDNVPNIKIEKEMLDLAKHIVKSKSGHFEPDKFEDRYER